MAAPRTRVRISGHAWERARQRMPHLKLSEHKLQRHLDGALRAGVKVNAQGAIQIPIGSGYEAICVPGSWGGWSVLTIIDASEEANRGA